MNDLTIMLLAATLAGIVQSTTGFGSSLVAMPILMHVMEPRAATPLMSLLSLLVSSSVFWRNRRSLDLARARGLILASAPGIPLGIIFLTHVPVRWIHLALGLMLVSFSVWSLVFRRGAEEETLEESLLEKPLATSSGLRDRLAVCITGFSSGLLGGAYNTSGPPLVLYGTIQRFAPARFKSILSAFFIFEGLVLMGFYSAFGLFTKEILGNFARLAPAMIVGMIVGFYLERLIPRVYFTRIVLVLLTVLGIKLIAF